MVAQIAKSSDSTCVAVHGIAVSRVLTIFCKNTILRCDGAAVFWWKHQVEFYQFFGRTNLSLLKGCLTKGSLVVWIVFVNPGCPNNFLYSCHLCEAMSTHTDPLIIRRAAFKCIYFSTKCLPPVLFHWMTTTCTFLKGLLKGNYSLLSKGNYQLLLNGN